MHYQNLLWHETTHSPYNPPASLHSLGDCQDENTHKKAERTQDYKSLFDSLGKLKAPENKTRTERNIQKTEAHNQDSFARTFTEGGLWAAQKRCMGEEILCSEGH